MSQKSKGFLGFFPRLVVGTAAAVSLGLPSDTNGTIAAARQRTQRRQHMRHRACCKTLSAGFLVFMLAE
jgi:hypothetical protein